MMNEGEKQQALKYRDHDLSIEDLSAYDIEMIRGQAIRNFVETRESDRVALIVASFLSFLTSKGFRVVDLNEYPNFTKKVGEK